MTELRYEDLKPSVTAARHHDARTEMESALVHLERAARLLSFPSHNLCEPLIDAHEKLGALIEKMSEEKARETGEA